MSSRSVGRGRCPRCGQEGSIIIRRVGDREYIYFKHGNKWCYIGPKDRVTLHGFLIPESVEVKLEQHSDQAQRQDVVPYRHPASHIRSLVRYLRVLTEKPALSRVVVFAILAAVALIVIMTCAHSLGGTSTSYTFGEFELAHDILVNLHSTDIVVVPIALLKTNPDSVERLLSSEGVINKTIVIIGKGENFDEESFVDLVNILLYMLPRGCLGKHTLAELYGLQRDYRYLSRCVVGVLVFRIEKPSLFNTCYVRKFRYCITNPDSTREVHEVLLTLHLLQEASTHRVRLLASDKSW